MGTHATKRWCAFGAAALAITLSTASAFADESEAERLFREGRALMLEGRFEEACPMLEQSQKLDAHVGTLLNLAACHERQGKVGSAWVEYQKALTAARTEGQGERARLAEQRIKVLEPRVPWLRISSAVDGAVLTLDGGELARVALGTEMPVDPGVHVVVAQREGATIFEERIELRESEHRSVHVSAPAPPLSAPAGPDPARLVVEQPAATTTAPPPPRRGRWIFEPGVFVAYLAGNASHPTLTNQAEVTVTSNASSTSTPESCSGRCTVGETKGASNAAVGVQVFGGYALSEQVHVGLRIVAAPSVKHGGVWGFGPEILLHPTDSISFGVWGLFGDASFRGQSDITPAPNYRASSSSGIAEGTLAGGLGLGVELSVRLFELGGGTVVANTTPFFLGGNGNAFCLPLGVAYHFQ